MSMNSVSVLPRFILRKVPNIKHDEVVGLDTTQHTNEKLIDKVIPQLMSRHG